ncbi:hypothetical protein LSH36_278g02074, partial [Paralvinella palmiformis]
PFYSKDILEQLGK